MYDVMLEEANMWLDEPPQRKRKLETPVNPPPLACPAIYEDSSDEEVDPVALSKYQQQVSESGGFDVDLFFQPFGGIVPSGCTDHSIIFGKVGLHCYNLEKGTNLQFKEVTKVNTQISSILTFFITLEATDPAHDDSPVTFQTCLTDTVIMHQARLRTFTTTCRIKPQVPGTGEMGSYWYPDKHVDPCYRVDLPNWPQDDALIGVDKLQFYEVKDWELKDNQWLYLYAEFALFSYRNDDLSAYMPFEMKKVVVQTKEDMKLKSGNAVFYLSFNTSCGRVCRGVVRRTTDGKPGHMCLEARCWVDK
ncbi:hypothetical protein Bca52824_000108 [Brassica carinata]|uniref:Uncharacterized protein n=1 Tax=Brassica carinata TaxID=52824 RepID=A0A8X8BC07_BRACI|nr:hypothetical protein Bca52824_000108 [Brassica carinata]